MPRSELLSYSKFFHRLFISVDGSYFGTEIFDSEFIKGFSVAVYFLQLIMDAFSSSSFAAKVGDTLFDTKAENEEWPSELTGCYKITWRLTKEYTRKYTPLTFRNGIFPMNDNGPVITLVYVRISTFCPLYGDNIECAANSGLSKKVRASTWEDCFSVTGSEQETNAWNLIDVFGGFVLTNSSASREDRPSTVVSKSKVESRSTQCARHSLLVNEAIYSSLKPQFKWSFLWPTP